MNQFYPNPYMMNPYGFNQFPQYQYPFTQNTDQTDEQSYIENILRLNLGKIISVYMNFENSQWGSKIFKGKGGNHRHGFQQVIPVQSQNESFSGDDAEHTKAEIQQRENDDLSHASRGALFRVDQGDNGLHHCNAAHETRRTKPANENVVGRYQRIDDDIHQQDPSFFFAQGTDDGTARGHIAQSLTNVVEKISHVVPRCWSTSRRSGRRRKGSGLPHTDEKYRQRHPFASKPHPPGVPR